MVNLKLNVCFYLKKDYEEYSEIVVDNFPFSVDVDPFYWMGLPLFRKEAIILDEGIEDCCRTHYMYIQSEDVSDDGLSVDVVMTVRQILMLDKDGDDSEPNGSFSLVVDGVKFTVDADEWSSVVSNPDTMKCWVSDFLWESRCSITFEIVEETHE